MSYEVRVYESVKKVLKKIQWEDEERLKSLILSLEKPYEVPHVKIKGEKGVYRATLGKYRVLYSTFDGESLVLVSVSYR